MKQCKEIEDKKPKKYAKYVFYNDEMPRLLLKEMGDEGMSVVRFCKNRKMSKRSFFVWLDKHEDFNEAYEQARTMCEGFWEEKLINMMQDKSVNSNLVKLFMTNRFGWSDRSEQKYSVTVEEVVPNLLDIKKKYGREY